MNPVRMTISGAENFNWKINIIIFEIPVHFEYNINLIAFQVL